ncbi:hypothetical protein COU61_02370 [Candidatus Pacearchaeota archaeon CG10_big_fil_rev_8_21_14_0_10_35_13]|nr:MAG: hypothetical protein COU61_02370 [Candidatus Pacearchaeota archaeon CG10_big_fil_rev_8_21_14_0_10_35_13]
MPENIYITNPGILEEKKKKIKEGGPEKFQLLTDFDRTLTKEFVKGKKTPSLISYLRNGRYLSEEYAKEAHSLFEKYRPIEISEVINEEDKNKAMHEWWKTHFELLVRSGLNKETINKAVEDILRNEEIELRKGTYWLLDYLKEKSIPIIIMSASIGDMIEEILRKKGKLYENVHVIANKLKWGKEEKFLGVEEPIIHSLNKKEVVIKNYPIYEKIKERKNILLLGGGTGDLGMAEGIEKDAMINIGFLNEDLEGNLGLFKEKFDVVITGDSDMTYVNDLMKEVLG